MSESWIVLAEAPFIPTMGGGEREHLGFMQTLVELGWLAALVVPSDANPADHGRQDDLGAIHALCEPAPVFATGRDRSARAALGLRPYVHRSRPFGEAEAREVLAAAPDATGVVSFSYKTAHMARLFQQLSGLPTVVRMHNVEGRYFSSIAASTSWPGKAPALVEAARIQADERLLERSGWVKGLADISRSDAEIRGRRATRPVEYVPTFALGPHRAGGTEQRDVVAEPVVLFLGALDVRTNVDAITWFAREVWPTVLQRVPEARWQLVGRAPSAEARSLATATAHCELHADVASTQPYYDGARVAINPAVSGSGVNIKLVEYLAAGIPVVSTTLGAQGVGLAFGGDLLVADEAPAFAKALVRLLTEDHACAELGAAGQRTAARILDVVQSARQLRDMLHR